MLVSTRVGNGAGDGEPERNLSPYLPPPPSPPFVGGDGEGIPRERDCDPVTTNN